MTDQERQQLFIVWGGILSSQVLVLLVAVGVELPIELPPIGGWALLAAGVVAGGLSLTIGRTVAPQIEARSAWIVRWALAEAVGMLGFVAAPSAPAVGFGLMGVGLLLTGSQPPRA